MEPAMAFRATFRQDQETFVRLVDGYLQEKRVDGASPRTVGHYKAVLEEVFLPFCEHAGVESPSQLTDRHLHDLGAGHLDGTIVAIEASDLTGDRPQLHARDQLVPDVGPRPWRGK